MTKISFCNYNGKYIFECMGHTEYASYGKDVLCSAISVLCYTLGAYLSRASTEGKICSYQSSFAPGEVHLSFELCDSYPHNIALHVVNAILDGFALLEESFPDYIKAEF